MNYKESHVTEDNAPRIAELAVKGVKYVNGPFTRGDLVNIAWIEIRRARIGQPIGSTISFVRLFLYQKMKRQKHKTRGEVSVSKLKPSSMNTEESSLSDIWECSQIDWDLLAVDIQDWLKVEVLALEGTIPDKQFIASKMCLLDGLEQKEVATKLNVSVGTTQCYISRTRVILNERWQQCQNA